MDLGGVLIVLAAYVALLFAAAAWGDRRADILDRLQGRRAWLYALGLGVYCTSWTFYGAVGEAAREGWDYLPIYLGPALLFAVFFPVIRRMVRLGREHDTASIADFLSARYGKSGTVAGLAAFVLLLATIPYIALQLRSAATSLSLLTGVPGFLDAAFLSAAAFAAFAILFGARRPDTAQGNRGLVLAVGIESVVKLIAMLAAGGFAVWLWLSLEPGERAASYALEGLASGGLDERFVTLTLLAGLAALCLPRQFHMMVVEVRDPADANRARWLFPAYLALIAMFAPPVALAGAALLPGGNPDAFVLALPLEQGASGLALFIFLGGFSAAAGMVTVAALAMSTMVVNDLLGPALMRGPIDRRGRDMASRLLGWRRLAVIALVAAAWLFQRGMPDGLGLADIGLVSFAGAAQLAPALLFGLYWRQANRAGAVAGVTAGLLIWAGAILAPTYAGLAPPAPEGVDAFSFAVVLSLAVNALAFIVAVAFSRAGLVDRIQADAFTGAGQGIEDASAAPEGARIADLESLLQRAIGERETRAALDQFSAHEDRPLRPGDPLTPAVAALAEARLARAVGASSARVLLTRVLPGTGVSPAEVVTLLDETAEKIRFSEDTLRATLEHLTQGVSVVDAELRLAAWNSNYVKMFGYPPELVSVGRPIADLIRWNAEQGEWADGDIESHVEKRLAHLREGRPHAAERVRRDGSVLEILGRPMPGGGYVTSYADITERKRTEEALARSERSIRFYTDNVPALLSYADRDHRLVFANQGYLDFFGIDRTRIGRPMKSFMSAEEFARRRPHMEAALKGERQEFDIIRPDRSGRRRIWQLVYQPRREDGEVMGYYGVYQDVTARREAEEGLRRAYETLEDQVEARTAELKAARRAAEAATASKTRFLAAASHDLLQPMSAARLLVSALESELEAAPEDTRQLARRIDRSIANADRLLRALLDISRLDADGVTPRVSAFRLDELLEDAASQFGPRARAKGLALTVMPTGLAVRSDRGLMTSVVQNLVSNAVRYTKEGRVLVGARRDGDQVRLQVFDTGPGIPHERREAIFREFERSGRPSDDDGGLGLGLAIVDRIARRLGHALTLRSEPGRGSMFEIVLPRAEPPAATPAPARRRGGASLEGLRVLCVENEPPVLEATTGLLGRWGCEAQGALDRAAAMAAFGGQPPDIVVLDYRLDDGDTGPAVYETLCEAWGARPPAILATAERGGEAEAAAAGAGMTMLAKPVAPAALRAAIAALRPR